MIRARGLALLGALAVAAIASPVFAQGYGYSNRQYYSDWHRPAKANYSYRNYYYKPAPDYSGYKHHYVIQPDNSQYNYYYSPYKKQYWGRCPIQTHGKGVYSLLAEKDRKGSLKEIPEDAFPEPGDLPNIPESTDGVKLDLGPDDLPRNVVKLP